MKLLTVRVQSVYIDLIVLVSFIPQIKNQQSKALINLVDKDLYKTSLLSNKHIIDPLCSTFSATTSPSYTGTHTTYTITFLPLPHQLPILFDYVQHRHNDRTSRRSIVREIMLMTRSSLRLNCVAIPTSCPRCNAYFAADRHTYIRSEYAKFTYQYKSNVIMVWGRNDGGRRNMHFYVQHAEICYK